METAFTPIASFGGGLAIGLGSVLLMLGLGRLMRATGVLSGLECPENQAEFVNFRTERDAQLAMPKLITPSLGVNMRAGEVPTDVDGNPMLKVPVNKL